ncbi:hypothetical protein H7F15_03050 [Pontibacter sp. Tf4]|uniref:hypothetical protein n=1 Tax=Pontibacter sp. Tf4 TaxID=2761620 RepID=UPI0016254FFA|nr:hypothetical protein [Pontibacter sp. Tf4]MBB6610003.1 hypothetical protein [Pontibacter sp. Tf4]
MWYFKLSRKVSRDSMYSNKKYFVTLICFLCALQIQSQNLLLNGDFEISTDCPREAGKIELCEGWTIPNYSTPDFYKNCDNAFHNMGVPQNIMGTQIAYSGESYAGIILFMIDYPMYREYIQGQLQHTLIRGIKYRVTMQISWAEVSAYFCEVLGYKFSEDNEGSKGEKSENKVKHKNVISRSSGSIPLAYDKLKDKGNWHEVTFIYTANGGEKFLTLGLFGDAFSNKQVAAASPVKGISVNKLSAGAYIYVDNIEVIELRN